MRLNPVNGTERCPVFGKIRLTGPHGVQSFVAINSISGTHLGGAFLRPKLSRFRVSGGKVAKMRPVGEADARISGGICKSPRNAAAQVCYLGAHGQDCVGFLAVAGARLSGAYQ